MKLVVRQSQECVGKGFFFYFFFPDMLEQTVDIVDSATDMSARL